MTQEINVMISSVINGLETERAVIKDYFVNFPYIKLIGANPYNDTAYPASSAYTTIEMARTCDLYVLILSEKYGTEILGGQSATEAEFDAAFKANPTKIMVFLRKNGNTIEKKQEAFIDKVSDYDSGYFRSSFESAQELKDLFPISFTTWIVNTAKSGMKLNYLDHFVMKAKQILPLDTIKVYYRVTEEYVQIEYPIAGTTKTIHFDNIRLGHDFWGCINELQLKCNEWSKDQLYKPVDNRYIQVLETKIRDKNTTGNELKRNLFDLGVIVGQQICADNTLLDVIVNTPMKAIYRGVKVDESKEYVVISTKDEYDYFAYGISKQLNNCNRGYIEFSGDSEEDEFCAKIRSIDLPNIKTGRPVEYIIIAKSVIATGCTAISLTKRAWEKYTPNGIIIASVFYSERGLLELKEKIPHAKIYVCTSPDGINADGMLLPGIGDIDIRMKS